MCGIIGAISKRGKKVGDAVIEKYNIQKSRGREGFGFCAVKDKQITVHRSEDEETFLKMLKKDKSPFIVAHHRFPTSTINVEECTHPIHVSHEELDYDYYVVHNGVIRNEDELKPKHEALKYVYKTELVFSSQSSYISSHTGNRYKTEVKDTVEFNDSESFAIELSRYLDGMTHKIDCLGSIAFICIQTTKEGKFVALHYGHNSGNPLKIEQDKNNIFIKSVGGTEIDEDVIYTLRYKNDGTIEESSVNIDIGYTSTYNKSNSTSTSGHLLSQSTYTRRMGFDTTNTNDDWDDINYKNQSELLGNEDEGRAIQNMVSEYYNLKLDLEFLEEDLAIAEDLLTQRQTTSDYLILTKEIADNKSAIKDTVEKMNKIEETYIYKIQGVEDFLDLVEAYGEEQEAYYKDMSESVEEVLADGNPL